MFLILLFQQDEVKENVTISELNFVPSTEDDGKHITCRAENPEVNGLFVETSWKIEVVCKYLSEFLCQLFVLFTQYIK